MKSLKASLIVIGTVGLMFLAACGSSTEETETATPLETTTETEATKSTAEGHDSTVSQGGQVIESGLYHLELVSLPEDSGVHLDFFLQTGSDHQAIPDAKVTGQVQLPNGEQKSLDFTYDSEGKHYFAVLPEKATGEYKVVIQTDIKGEKVNGRFSFNQ
ncbi:MAG: DUF4426 domain-containing protein [Symploca sp. SIO1A3]|nr:DUF4426 domain-containing protein [Symploca sp. SIO1A3]